MKSWKQSKTGYYLDFIIVPILMLVTAGAALAYGASPPLLAASAAAGFAAWTYAEYWIHRTLFHRYYRREHWLHHKDPGGYVAAPPWLTAAAHATALVALTHLGPSVGAGLFLGLEAGYMAYIVTHDAIHHATKKGRWMRTRSALHGYHHDGAEKNFGVVTSLVDRLHGTYENPALRT